VSPAISDLTFKKMSLFTQDGIRRKRKDFEIDAAWKCGVGCDDVVQQTLGARAAARRYQDEVFSGRGLTRQPSDDFRSGLVNPGLQHHVNKSKDVVGIWER
jgi:hypothetical protein